MIELYASSVKSMNPQTNAGHVVSSSAVTNSTPDAFANGVAVNKRSITRYAVTSHKPQNIGSVCCAVCLDMPLTVTGGRIARP